MSIFVVLAVLHGCHSANLGDGVVYPRLLEGRSSDALKIVHVRDGLTLNLERVKIAADEVVFRRDLNGKTVDSIVNGSELNKNLYQDIEKMASLILTQTDNVIEMEGLVSGGLKIQPMKEMERSQEGLMPHLISEVTQTNPSEGTQLLVDKDDTVRPSPRSNSLPKEYLIETFIILDHAHLRHFQSEQEAQRYVAIFCASVNIRFSTFRNPGMKILVVGIQYGLDDKHIHGSDKAMDDDKTMPLFQAYVASQEIMQERADIVVLLTGRDMYTQAILKDYGIDGIAYLGGVCTQKNVGIVEDIAGSYKAVLIFTHETSHLLGASHDEEKFALNLEGYPSSEHCAFDDGYIMSYVDGGPRHYLWSNCSQRQIRHVLWVRSQTCWRVRSAMFLKLPHRLPGQMLNATEYCARLYPKYTEVTATRNFIDAQQCKVECCIPFLWCEKVQMLDFMNCGDHRVCLNGKCIYLPSGSLKSA